MNEHELCLYVVTQDRTYCLNRMLASVVASSRLPERILIITPNRGMFDSMYNTVLRRSLQEAGVALDVLLCEKKSGLSERKNIALNFMKRGTYAYGLSIDDDMVLDPHCIERLVEEIEKDETTFAVGPTVLQAGAKGLTDSEILRDEKMAEVVDGVWEWRGFAQGIGTVEPVVYPVEHLAGCYLHRVEEEDSYDEGYDRPGHFLHESDFLFRRGLVVVKNAVVHHWPPMGVTLWNSKDENQPHILKNVKYFANKHGLGKVKSISWEGFEEVDYNDSRPRERKPTRTGNSRTKKRDTHQLQGTTAATNDNNRGGDTP